jgi:site-specific recombinase XerD
MVLDGLQSANSRRCYAQALNEFFSWHTSTEAGPFTKATVQSYRTHLQSLQFAPTTINQHLSAIRKLAREASDNGLLDPQVASGIARIRGYRPHGVRSGNWLGMEDAERLIQAPDASTAKGRRDRAALALMIGCGLRRSEIAGLDMARVQIRDARWVVVDLVGKGGRVRTVPIPDWVKAFMDEWLIPAGITEGFVFRAIDKADRITRAGISSQGIYDAVKTHGFRHGMNIAPHDLRRTFAKLARAGDAAIEQIQIVLGHASILTTERYLGTKQDLKNGPGDRIRICFNRAVPQAQPLSGTTSASSSGTADAC